MAAVYKAYQPGLDRYVALKVLPAHLADEPGFAERFKREARAVAKLEHPHILPVYDYGQEGDLSYIAMRYVEGGTLKALLGKPLELALIVGLIAQIGEALDYAHDHGVIHRDVKPSNVLLDKGNWALLTDFGVARMVEATQQLTATGVGVGTPAYMSPEQGQGKKVDGRSDIYSLGVVLYEMLTGRVPFEAETPLAVVWKHVNEPLPLPRSINPDVPEAVERVVLKAMAKAPEDRFGSASLMALDLETSSSQQRGPLGVHKEGPRPPASGVLSWIASRVRPISLLGGLVLVGAIIILGLRVGRGFTRFGASGVLQTETQYTVMAASGTQITDATALPSGNSTRPGIPTAQDLLPNASSTQRPSSTATASRTVTPTIPAGVSALPIKVAANLPWQDTGVEVSSGQIVDIGYASGEWTTFKGFHPYVHGEGNKGLNDPKNPNHPLPSAYPGVLIGRVGTGNVFEVGNARTFVADGRGHVFLQMNDDYLQDNDGALEVKLSVYSDPPLYDDFGTSTFDGAFNGGLWSRPTGLSVDNLRAKQANGSLVFEKMPNPSELDRVLTAVVQPTLRAGGFGLVEGELELGLEPIGSLAFAKIQLVADVNGSTWWTQCRLNGYGSRSPDFVCDVSRYSNEQYTNDFLSDSYPIDYETWYRVAILIDPESGRLSYFLGDQFVGSYEPPYGSELLRSDFNLQVGVWQEVNSSVTAYVDEVRVAGQ
jgi:serine/threonine protein kinase